jgi:hypothetical protein
MGKARPAATTSADARRHQAPVAEEEVHLLLIEPTGTPNTGDAKTAATRKLA